MTYSQWVKKYATDKYEDAMDNFWASFNKWVNDTPKVWGAYFNRDKDKFDYRAALDMLFANGITEG